MDIYDVNEALVKKLVSLGQIELCSSVFHKTKPNHKRVDLVLHMLVGYQILPNLELNTEFRLSKNNAKSINFRKQGNEYFSLKNKDYFKALSLYNESISFAEYDSENISIGYANRSAILFEWGLYKECLENIKLAREANYPERLASKLDKREKECLSLLDTQKTEQSGPDFQLSFDAHPQIPSIANCLEMKYTEENGRHICTNRTLKPGDLVSIEEPFCSTLLPSMKYVRCANCKMENHLTLIPCPNCTSAMFCSKECLEEGTANFHRFECSIIDFLFTVFSKIPITALRVSLIALSLFETPDEFQEFCSDPANDKHNAYTLDYSNFSKKEQYKAIHGLVTNEEKRTVADLFQRAVIIAVMQKYLFSHTPLGEILPNQTHRNFFIDLLFRHLQTCPSNMHSIDCIEQQNEDTADQTFATAAYPFASLLNHSCSPNTVRIYKGTQKYLFILRPIPENGQLYDNYGYHYVSHLKKMRQQNLETQWRFKCKCEACKNNYPLYKDLESPKEVPVIAEAGGIETLWTYNKQFALQNYQRYSKYLLDYKDYYPCSQLFSGEECLKMSLNILADAVPLKAKY